MNADNGDKYRKDKTRALTHLIVTHKELAVDTCVCCKYMNELDDDIKRSNSLQYVIKNSQNTWKQAQHNHVSRRTCLQWTMQWTTNLTFVMIYINK